MKKLFSKKLEVLKLNKKKKIAEKKMKKNL